MKKKSYDIALLLIVLLLFSASLGVLHGRKDARFQGISVADDVARIILSKVDALAYLDRLVIGGNVDAVARVLHQFDDQLLFQTLDAILAEQYSALTPEQKIQLLLALIVHDPASATQNIFVNKLADLFAEYPVFYYAVGFYKDAIPVILRWGKKSGRNVDIKRWIRASFNKVIGESDIEGIKTLITYEIPLSKRDASLLLRQVVLQARPIALVPLLVQEFGANPNYAADKKHTILMEAVETNNVPMVRALLEAGADKNLVLDPAVGSAKQLSFQKGYVDIDLLFGQPQKAVQ